MKKQLVFIISLLVLISCNNDSDDTNKSILTQNITDSLKNVIVDQSAVIEGLLAEKVSIQSSIEDIKSDSNPSKLYGEITPTKITDYIITEVLNQVDTSFNYYSRPKDISVTIHRCGNGPSDPNKDYCNGSYNLYIATAQTDLPPTYFLHEVGPFVSLKIDSVNIDSSLLYITHDNNGNVKSEIIEITLNDIKI
jgi:hypothetical protein